jgi:hypothetical protein
MSSECSMSREAGNFYQILPENLSGIENMIDLSVDGRMINF